MARDEPVPLVRRTRYIDGMRLILTLVALAGAFVLVAMTIAPSQPALRDWYDANACGTLDKVSTDICAGIRRARRSTN